MRTRFLLPSLAATLLLALCAAAPAAMAQTAIDQGHPLAAGGRVEVGNVAGEVRVRGWDRDEVAISGTLQEGQRLDVDASRNRVRVQVVQSDESRRGSVRGARLELRVPAGSELQVTVVSAEVDIAEVDLGRLQARSVSGDIRVAGRAGDVELGSVSGDVHARTETGRFSAETVSGRIDAGGGIGGTVRAETVSGAVVLAGGDVDRLTGQTISGALTIRPGALAPGGRIDLQSLSGRIGLQLPADTSAQLRVSTFSGGIESDAGQVERPRHGPGRSLATRLGGGDGDVAVTSHSGRVRVDLAPHND